MVPRALTWLAGPVVLGVAALAPAQTPPAVARGGPVDDPIREMSAPWPPNARATYQSVANPVNVAGMRWRSSMRSGGMVCWMP